MSPCACKCGCSHSRVEHCNGLCQRCWLEWCQGSEGHAPVAPNSYLDTYGIHNIWAGWLINQAPELVAETPEALLRPEAPHRCPDCGQQMARRPGGWKCYYHEPPVVILEQVKLPGTAYVNALRCLP